MAFIRYIEPVFLGVAFCMYVISSLEVQLVYHKACLQHYNATFCQILYNTKDKTYKTYQDSIQELSSQWTIYINLTRLLPSLVTSLLCTGWFDSIGRKRFLFVPLVGSVLCSIGYIVNSYFMNLPVYWMFLGVFLDGVFGSNAIMISAIVAYLADTTSNENRTKRFVILDAMLFLGGVIAEITTGLIMQNYGFIPPFSIILTIYVSLMVYWCFLEESYPPDVQEITSSVFKRIKHKLVHESYRLFFQHERRKTFLVLLTSYVLAFSLIISWMSTTVLYILRAPINFTPSYIGFYTAGIQLLKFIGSIATNYFLLTLWKWSDKNVVLVFCLFSMGFYVMMAFANSQLYVFLTGVWTLGMGIGVSTMRGMLSKMCSPQEQGLLSIILGCFENISALLASTITSAIYKATVASLPSTIFFIFTGVVLVIVALTGWLIYMDRLFEYKVFDSDQNERMENKTINS